MDNNLFEGERVRLRAIRASDWEAFHAMDQDTELARHGWQIPFPRSPEAARKWAEEKALATPEHDNFFWVIENKDGEIVGSLNTHGCEPRNGTFEYGIAIRRKHWRKGYAREAILLLLTYYFRELRYQKCTITAFAFNEPSIRLHEKLGFKQEGRLRRMVYTDGKYYDELVFGMTVEEFEALWRGGTTDRLAIPELG